MKSLKITLKTLLSFCLIIFNFEVKSQNLDLPIGVVCATDDHTKADYAANPSKIAKQKQIDENYFANVNDKTATNATVYTIPVVVHVMHLPGTPVGQNENISQAQIKAGILHMTEAFRRQAGITEYTGAGHIPSISGVDIEIQFELAKRDPAGNPTDGINRVATTLSNLNADNVAQNTSMKSLSNWNTAKYLNIWLVNEICTIAGECGVAGYATFPTSTAFIEDGIVNESRFFGSSRNNSKVHIHEAGHYFNLYHTFQNGCTNNNCLTDGDQICDTPPDNSQANVTCGAAANSCTTDQNDINVRNPFRPVANGGIGGVDDSYENYMDYGLQSCQTIFTNGQKTRMRDALLGPRASLITSNLALTPPTVPNFAFFDDDGGSLNESQAITAGGGRTYFDYTVPIKLFAAAALATTVNVSIDATSTALSPADYQLLSNSITIAVGASSGSIILRIFDDRAIEISEKIVLKVTGTNVNNTFTYTIIDNDTAPSGTPTTVFTTSFDTNNGWLFSNFGAAGANSFVIAANGGTCTTGNSLYITNNKTTNPNTYTDETSSPIAIKTINAIGRKKLSAIFDYKIGGVAGGDFGAMAVRPNQTAPFSYVSDFYGKNSVTCLQQAVVPLPATLDNTNFDIGFNFVNAAGNGNPAPGLTVDNLTIQAAATPIATTLNQSIIEYLGPNSTVFFVPNPGEVMVKIENLTAHDYGLTTMTIDRAGLASVQNAGGTYKYASKTVLITPTNNNPAGSYRITLYYTQPERDGWVSSSGLPLANLKVLKSPASIATATDINTFEGATTSGTFGTGFTYQAQFNTGFSGFTIGARNATSLAATVSNQVNVLCKGGNTGSVTITPSGGLAPYVISPSQTNLTAGLKTFTVTDAQNNTTTLAVTITEPSLPLAATSTQSNVTCFGLNNGSVSFTTTGGTAPYTISPAQTGLAAGTYTFTITDANLCSITKSIAITAPSLALSASSSQVNVLCKGQNTGSVAFTTTGGTAPYTISPAQTGLAAGTYTFTISDANLCSITKAITITEPALPLAATSSQVNVLCKGLNNGSVAFTTTGGTAPYTISPAQTGLAAGTYTFTITDANNCSITKSITITEPSFPLAATSTQSNVTCFGVNNGSVAFTTTGGTAPYIITPAQTGLAAGTYTFTITDANLCSITKSIIITAPILALSATSSQVDILCKGQSTGSVAFTTTGGTAPYTISPAQTGLAAGTYTFTISDANLCSITKAITITEPALPLAATSSQVNVLCKGLTTGSVVFTTTGGTAPYTISPAQTGLAAGTYTFTITDANLCSITSTITITEPELPLSATTSQTNVSCFGENNGSVAFTTTGGTAPYTISPAQTGLAAGTYTFTITDANLCSITKAITITEPALPLAATSTQIDVSCKGGNDGSVTFTATGGTSPYSILPSQTGLTAGTYDFTITDANNCTIIKSITITEPALPLTAVLTSFIDVECLGTATGSVNITPSGGTAPYTISPVQNGLEAGNYVFTVTDSKLCTTTVEATIAAPDPIIVSSNSVNIAINTSTLLTANCGLLTTKWYNASETTLLFSGENFTTPSLSVNTTYKVRCESADCANPFATIAVNIIQPNGQIVSVKSGNWEDASTWDANRVPLPTDNVLIEKNHIVNVFTNTAKAKTLCFATGGNLKFLNSTAKLTLFP
jgi:hypothetical protein